MKQLSLANRAASRGVPEGLAGDPVLRGSAAAGGELREHLHACACVYSCVWVHYLFKVCPSGGLWGQSLDLPSGLLISSVGASVRPIWP